jgi:hypothetical protein
MNLNPFENEKCTYDIRDLFIEKESEYSWNRLKANKELLDKFNQDWDNYGYILKSISDKVNWFIEGGYKDYQGEIYWLGKDNDGFYYFVNTGYGSCSGCDSYQAAEGNIQELEEIRQGLKRDIKQFESLEEFKNYISGEVAEGSFYWHDDDFKDFIEKLNNEFGWNLKVKSRW